LPLVATTEELNIPALGKDWYEGLYIPQPNLLAQDYALVATQTATTFSCILILALLAGSV